MRPILASFVMFVIWFVPPAYASASKDVPTAPALSFQELLQAPTGARTTWNSLRGKVVVLEFWATWCGPCVANIPHLNQLADAFPGKVQFIAIDDESPAVVRRFLTSHPMHSWIGMDETKTTFRSYHVAARPTTVVIDANGRIVKVGVPEDVTPKLLSAVLRPSKPQDASAPPETMATASHATDESVSRLRLSLTDAVDTSHFLMASDNGIVQAHSATALQILSLLYGADRPDILLETTLPDRPYDLEVNAPGVQEAALLKVTQAAFTSSLHIEPHWENRERDVYVLRADNSARDKLPVSTIQHGGYMMLQGSKLDDVKVTMPQFVSQLGYIFQMHVVDSTGLEGHYDIAFTVPSDKEELLKQINTLGLHLERDRKVIRSLVVSSPQP